MVAIPRPPRGITLEEDCLHFQRLDVGGAREGENGAAAAGGDDDDVGLDRGTTENGERGVCQQSTLPMAGWQAEELGDNRN